MKLEIGKRYRTRDGQVTAPIHESVSRVYPYRGIVRGNGEEWTKDGRYTEFGPDDRRDLVEEATTATVGPAQGATLIKCHFTLSELEYFEALAVRDGQLSQFVAEHLAALQGLGVKLPELERPSTLTGKLFSYIRKNQK